MALILYTWGNKFVKKQFLGIKPCPQCGNLTEQYLKRQFFTLGIFYVPIVWIPTKRWYVCESCGAGVQLDRKQFGEMKAQYRNMPKKNKMLSAFGRLETIVPALPDAERTVDNIYGRIAEGTKFTSEEEPFVREMIEGYLAYNTAAAAASAAADTVESAAAAAVTAEAAPYAAGAEADDTAAPAESAAYASAGSTANNADAPAAPLVIENPLNQLPTRGKQTVYSPQTVDGQPVVYTETQPVRKRKWGWFAAGIVQTFVMLFGLLMLFVGFGDGLFDSGLLPGMVMILIFGIIPVGLTVLFFSLFASK